MTYGLVSILLPVHLVDPLAGIVVGGSVGVVAALLCAALLGSGLNTLRGKTGTPNNDQRRHTVDHRFREAA